MSYGDQDFSEDLFEHTKMSFWDHIEVLRAHMLKAIGGFLIAMIGSFFVGERVLVFIAAPVEQELNAFYDRRVEEVEKKLKDGDAKVTDADKPREMEMTLSRSALAKALGIKDPPAGGSDEIDLIAKVHPVKISMMLSQAQRIVGRRPTLSTLSITEALVVYFKVCIYVGILASAPWIFYQMWSFVAAGLYPHEKRLVNVYMPFSIILFLLGAALCQFGVIPAAVRYLLGFNEWIGLEPDLRLNEWLSFAIMFPLIFGLSFQLPIVMLGLHRIGIMDVSLYRKHRRIAMFLMVVLAILLTASPDPFSTMALTVPLWALYELGIILCAYSPRPLLEMDEPDQEEMVEV